MKTKNFNKKLSLNKRTVVDLDNDFMNRLLGGRPYAIPETDISFCGQDSCEECTSLVPVDTCGGLSMCVCNSDEPPKYPGQIPV